MDATAELNRENLPETNHDVVIADIEAWLTAWLNRAMPIALASYHAFMGMVKSKVNEEYDLEAEASCFYELLVVTRELTSCKPYLKKSVTLFAPAMYQDDYLEMVNEVDKFLASVEARCVESAGVKCISKSDLIEFLSIAVKFIRDIAEEIAKVVERAIEPFNDFVQEFDNSLKIDLVDGNYHLIVNQQLDEKIEEVEHLNKRIYSSNALGKVSEKDVKPEVYVVTSNNDLVEYIEKRWAGTILLTNHAVDSILESPFRDLRKIIASFDILGEEFYQCFAYDQRLHDATKALAEINVEFKPQISEKAKGRHNIYKRPYRNRTANFDKHLCLGTSRDAAHCYRIHFEYCSEEKKIVIHHAGKHLPMSDD